MDRNSAEIAGIWNKQILAAPVADQDVGSSSALDITASSYTHCRSAEARRFKEIARIHGSAGNMRVCLDVLRAAKGKATMTRPPSSWCNFRGPRNRICWWWVVPKKRMSAAQPNWTASCWCSTVGLWKARGVREEKPLATTKVFPGLYKYFSRAATLSKTWRAAFAWAMTTHWNPSVGLTPFFKVRKAFKRASLSSGAALITPSQDRHPDRTKRNKEWVARNMYFICHTP